MILYRRNSCTGEKIYYKILVLTICSIGLIPSLLSYASAEEEVLPSWLKNIAVWWGEDQISDQEFVNSLQFLVENKILVIPEPEISKPACGPGLVFDDILDECVIPEPTETTGIFPDSVSAHQIIVISWVKATTMWWGQDKISDQDFINALQYLVENDVLTTQPKIQPKSPFKQEPLPSTINMWPKIAGLEDFQVQGHGQTDTYYLQFKLIDNNGRAIDADGTVSFILMDDRNRILYLDAFSVRKAHYSTSFDSFGDKEETVYNWTVPSSDIRAGFSSLI